MTVSISCSSAWRQRVALALVDGNLKGVDELTDTLELRSQLRRRGRTMGLIFLEPFVAEGGHRQIERNGAVRWLPVLQASDERVNEPVHPPHVLARCAHRQRLPDGMPRAMHKGVPIHQHKQRLAFEHGLGTVAGHHALRLARVWRLYLSAGLMTCGGDRCQLYVPYVRYLTIFP